MLSGFVSRLRKMTRDQVLEMIPGKCFRKAAWHLAPQPPSPACSFSSRTNISDTVCYFVFPPLLRKKNVAWIHKTVKKYPQLLTKQNLPPSMGTNWSKSQGLCHTLGSQTEAGFVGQRNALQRGEPASADHCNDWLSSVTPFRSQKPQGGSWVIQPPVFELKPVHQTVQTVDRQLTACPLMFCVNYTFFVYSGKYAISFSFSFSGKQEPRFEFFILLDPHSCPAYNLWPFHKEPERGIPCFPVLPLLLYIGYLPISFLWEKHSGKASLGGEVYFDSRL